MCVFLCVFMYVHVCICAYTVCNIYFSHYICICVLLGMCACMYVLTYVRMSTEASVHTHIRHAYT